MNIIEATRSFESWLDRQTPLLRGDLASKHEAMGKKLFPFLRATYYRWAQTWAGACPDLAGDPTVLAVGDLHVENFGTWRDVDGRLVWGINDFDECYLLPFSNDLVRLAVSAHVAIADGEMTIAPKAASGAIIAGYQACLKAGGRPLVLVDASTPLRVMARHRLENPEQFWDKLLRHPPIRDSIPGKVKRVIGEILPERELPVRFVRRTAGLGSLGKRRFTGVGTWLGGNIAREAKALTRSACCWAEAEKGGDKIYYAKLLRRAVRCPDPLVAVRGKWLVRRLSPDCFHIPLDHLPHERNEGELLYSMGWETANVHLGTATAGKLAGGLKRKPAGWLHRSAKSMHESTRQDWEDWVRRS